MIEFSLLGPLEAVADGAPLMLGPPKQQVVLAMLALRPGRLVEVDELVDELWPEKPPTSAVANARGYAGKLRRTFDQIPEGRGLLSPRRGGYELRLPSDAVDVFRFVSECQRVGVALAGGDFSEADELMSRVEGRWRGRMLPGLPLGPMLSARAEAVGEMRLALVEQRAELFLATGESAAALALLRGHLLAHPLREHGHALLMRALCQQGNICGALSAYTAARSQLVEQLGIEPGIELRQLHQAVLNRDPALEGPRTVIASGVPKRPGPSPETPAPAADGSDQAASQVNWLPWQSVPFTGRSEILRGLLATLRDPKPGTAVVQVINGMAGVGKTTFAVEVASQLADDYPDAQLFIDLQGHGAGGQMEPAAALVILLRQLGVPASRIPVEPDDRIMLWRAELAARRSVLVLDNVGSSEQLTPLLPTSPGTLVLVTSRRRLLVSGHTPPTSLTVLAPNEAIDLLARVAGRDRIDTDSDSAATVVRLCGYLPLAIRLAGARLAHRPGWRVADLARRLHLATPLMNELTAEDHSVAGAFRLTYEPLREPVRRMFRMLSLHPGRLFGLDAAAALTDLPLAEAEGAVAELVNFHLLEEPEVGRFQFHDLVRDYARGLALSIDEPADRTTAIGRLLDYCMYACLAATRAMGKTTLLAQSLGLEQPLRPDLVSALPPSVHWLEQERDNLCALVRLAAEGGHPDQAWRLTRLTWRFYFVRGYPDHLFEAQKYGLAAARQLNDQAAIGMICNYRAFSHLRTGDCEQALRDLETAVEARESIGDRLGASVSRGNIAIVYWHLGRLTESVELSRRDLRDRRSLGRNQPFVMSNIALPLMFLGRYEEALHTHRQHLFQARLTGSPFNIALALSNIGAVRSRLGQHSIAARYLRVSLGLMGRLGMRFGTASSFNELGGVLRELRQLNEAQKQHELALTAARNHGEKHNEAAALNGIGLILAAQGRPAAAVEAHYGALTLASRISHPYEQGRALAGIAHQIEPEDPVEARRYWMRALAIFRKMEVPERFEVEQHLKNSATTRSRDDGQPPWSSGGGVLPSCRPKQEWMASASSPGSGQRRSA
ncbi:BTAD domain-containing putative transcriptional regulator [Micromonospora sp. NPDC048839]|uniref:AfsR/SARP family transcriptional regulator n=1 Tax=Micromonospora sp. NPDC048839 TaxID=3155641 RepID=UPI0033EC9962